MTRRNLRFSLFLLALVVAACEPPPETDFDVIIRGGTIYDGSGGDPFVADIAFDGERIAQIGDLGLKTADVTVDATGLAVSPGFINMLSWATESLIEDGRAMSDIKQGVTLEIMGEGFSMGPLNDAMKADMQERQGDIQFDVEWTTLGEYLDYLVERGISPNVASYVGAANMRIHEVGFEDLFMRCSWSIALRGMETSRLRLVESLALLRRNSAASTE